ERIALVVFDGVAGQQASLNIGSVSVPQSLVTIYNPDGTKLASTAVSTGGATISSMILPATGTYTILIVPGRLISLVAGNGSSTYSGDGGPATSAGTTALDV